MGNEEWPSLPKLGERLSHNLHVLERGVKGLMMCEDRGRLDLCRYKLCVGVRLMAGRLAIYLNDIESNMYDSFPRYRGLVT